jgi:acetylcholinesterase
VESAGAFSVGLHLLYGGQTSTNLFRAGILESGSATSSPYKPASEYQPSYDAVVNSTGCSSASNTLDCLRNVPLDQFVAVTNKSIYSWYPAVDGVFIKDLPSRLLTSGKHVRVPLLLGRTFPSPSPLHLSPTNSVLRHTENTDEGSSFGKKHLNTTSNLIAALQLDHPHLTNSSIDRLLELYPDDPFYGCPYNTGDAYLTSGRQDKRSNAIWGDTRMHAGVSLSFHRA